MSTYIIPDIHGCLKTLKCLVECNLNITLNDRLYFLGDYIDRGPNGAGVIEYIIGLKELGYNINCLMGNHEQMLLKSPNSQSDLVLWLLNSGESTISSYNFQVTENLNILEKIPPNHLNFLQSLSYYTIVDDQFILVHGGINYYSEVPFNDVNAMLWNRYLAVPDSFMPGYKILHGHSVEPLEYIIDNLYQPDSRIFGLDAGCVFKGQTQGVGYLTALDLEQWKLKFVECLDV